MCPKRSTAAFSRKKDAEVFKNGLLLKVAKGNYVDERAAPTVGKAIDHWLADKDGKVKASTLGGYKVVANGAIRGPLLDGTRQQRADYTHSGVAPSGARFTELLGNIKLPDLTTPRSGNGTRPSPRNAATTPPTAPSLI